ncbi:MAG: hypothetical protein ABR527_02900 [Gemmatimonadota bacterium]
MIDVMMRLRVKDYPHWKKVFDKAETFRRERGEAAFELYQAAHDSGDLVLLFRWDEMGVARDFFDAAETRRLWDQGGILGDPEVTFLKLVDRGEAFGRKH